MSTNYTLNGIAMVNDGSERIKKNTARCSTIYNGVNVHSKRGGERETVKYISSRALKLRNINGK